MRIRGVQDSCARGEVRPSDIWILHRLLNKTRRKTVPVASAPKATFEMTKQTYALPPGSRILVTGANGYIASHVVDLLLKRGYRVRGQVRQSRPWLDKFFHGRYGDLFESVVVPDLEDREAISPLLKDVSGVMLIVLSEIYSFTLC